MIISSKIMIITRRTTTKLTKKSSRINNNIATSRELTIESTITGKEQFREETGEKVWNID